MRHARKKSPITLVKKHWIERAIEVENYHIWLVKEYGSWTILQTATLLNRSEGSVNEDMMIASWMKTHETELRNIKNRNDALIFIRAKKKAQRLTPFDSQANAS